MRAVAIAAPVLDRLAMPSPTSWKVVGGTRSTVYLAYAGFVMALNAPGVPRMANGVLLERPLRHLPPIGSVARCEAGLIRVGTEEVRWSVEASMCSRRPSTPAAAWPEIGALAARGRAALALDRVPAIAEPAPLVNAIGATGVTVAAEPEGRQGVMQLLKAIQRRSPPLAACALNALLGRGDGLTPEGDDWLCGAAATVAVAGAAAGLGEDERRAWLQAVRPLADDARSSDLSLTLLRLAVDGHLSEPASAILDPAEPDWRGALARLREIGSSTGRAYALAIGSTALLLASPAPGVI